MLNHSNEELYDCYVKNSVFVTVDHIENINNIDTSHQIIIDSIPYYYSISENIIHDDYKMEMEFFVLHSNFSPEEPTSIYQKKLTNIHRIEAKFTEAEMAHLSTLSIEGKAKSILERRFPRNPNSIILAMHLLLKKLVLANRESIERDVDFEFMDSWLYCWYRDSSSWLLIEEDNDYPNKKGAMLEKTDVERLESLEKRIPGWRYVIQNFDLDCESLSSHQNAAWHRYLAKLEKFTMLTPEKILQTDAPALPSFLHCKDINCCIFNP